MAENKTKQTKVSASRYIAGIGDESKRADAKALAKLLQDVTGEKPAMWGPSIVGFGSYHYKYESGREGDMCKLGFSSRKDAIALYGVGIEENAALVDRLGKIKTGKGCLYVRKLAEVDLKVLDRLLAAGAARHA